VLKRVPKNGRALQIPNLTGLGVGGPAGYLNQKWKSQMSNIPGTTSKIPGFPRTLLLNPNLPPKTCHADIIGDGSMIGKLLLLDPVVAGSYPAGKYDQTFQTGNAPSIPSQHDLDVPSRLPQSRQEPGAGNPGREAGSPRVLMDIDSPNNSFGDSPKSIDISNDMDKMDISSDKSG
jgi:hypothetical protein